MKIFRQRGVWSCAFALLIFAVSVSAEETGNNDDAGVTIDSGKNRSWYLGAGIGLTELDPDTGGTGYSVSDERDTGFKLFGGFDYSERLTVEGFYSDLGTAQLTSLFPSQPDGKVDYSTAGVSVLWYLWRNGENKGNDLRKGLQAYAHGGLSFLKNSSTLAFSQSNNTQVQYGAGLEYGVDNGIAVRAGLDLYDKDAGMLFVSIIKRFGIEKKRKIIVKPEPVIKPAPVIVVPDIDSDGDGVFDRLDQCANSPVGIKVDEDGCSMLDIEFTEINFAPESYELTEESKFILDEAVDILVENPGLRIEVQAHTDYKGSGSDNQILSERRAESVKRYLISEGVQDPRLVTRGYGESMPIADNHTAEGRAKNRRVELVVIKDKAKPLPEKEDIVEAGAAEETVGTESPEITNDAIDKKISESVKAQPAKDVVE